MNRKFEEVDLTFGRGKIVDFRWGKKRRGISDRKIKEWDV